MIRHEEDRRFPYSLGATLYMPMIHPKVGDILSGHIAAPASSIVLCLEDGLHENDVERGVANLRGVLASPVLTRARIFVRPRSFEMACRLADMRGISSIEGFVAPKMRAETMPEWLDLVAAARLTIMPTLETADCFDPARVVAMRDILRARNDARIVAVRLGGNDLLGVLSLRRHRGMTSYDGPLGWVLCMLSSIMISSGIPVAAPVFDIIDDLDTLSAEVERDMEMGFVSKTAIHPAQVPIIEAAMGVKQDDLAQARAILDEHAKAVFQIGGVMCEPSTHRSWAERILSRHGRYGVIAEKTAGKRVST